MTDREVIDRVIKQYTEAIKEIDHWYIGNDTAFNIVVYHNVSSGICKCIYAVSGRQSSRLLNIWIFSFPVQEGFWFPTPFSLTKKKDVLNSLKLRLERLKTYC